MSLLPLRRFVTDFAALLDSGPADEARILEGGDALLRRLIARDDWLPEAFAASAPPYGQHLLHCDSAERFSVVSFVWGPGQSTPAHDHTVWGLIGVLRGEEVSQPFTITADGLRPGEPATLRRGETHAVSPSIGDIHKVSNALADRPSVSIHVYGANIGAVTRSTFNAAGEARPFVSGYSSEVLPNIWGPARLPSASK